MFRLLSCFYALGFQIAAIPDLDRPALAWLLFIVPIAGGLALTAAAVTKLVIFDFGRLDGIFRVTVFIVVGLVLSGMGTGYARSLAQQDRSHQS